ncbi:MAG TPA: sigma factor-like helix-turn-helix DNA-binding protein [Kofleriaceae bacterium]|nr:sigma factor-like helix-turn-helix DNA-binding protein [Kofleriaceae bacterium]
MDAENPQLEELTEFDDEAATTELVREPAIPELSRKLRRQRRSRPRSKTIAMRRITVAQRQIFAELYPVDEIDEPRPQTRAECRGQARPCPWVSCKHHLYLDVNPMTGSIKINFPDLEPWELPHTCALDVAEAGALTLEQVGEITNLTRERIRQVEARGLVKLRERRELR